MSNPNLTDKELGPNIPRKGLFPKQSSIQHIFGLFTAEKQEEEPQTNGTPLK